jgi:hypothetical protein
MTRIIRSIRTRIRRIVANSWVRLNDKELRIGGAFLFGEGFCDLGEEEAAAAAVVL